MEVTSYIADLKRIQLLLIDYLGNAENDEENYENLIQFIQDQKILQDKNEIKAIFQLINIISCNHLRNPNFFEKIIKIYLFISPGFFKFFNWLDLFMIFKDNKRMLLFFLETKVIPAKPEIANMFITPKYENLDYILYFLPEVRACLPNAYFYESLFREKCRLSPQIGPNYNQLRKNGENHTYICELIRDDNIEEFISYIKKYQIQPTSFVEQSLFETHNFLLKKQATLVQYAAFFGSTQIFKYLSLNGAIIDSNIWLYAIYGYNSEIIDILIEKNVPPQNNDYGICINRALKCHHNEIANFIQNKFLLDANLSEVFNSATKFLNFAFFPSSFNQIDLYNLCYSGLYLLVNLLIENTKLDINAIVIL